MRKELARLTQVTRIGLKYGLGYFIQEMGLRWHLPFLTRFAGHEHKVPEGIPRRMREALEAMGGAFVKFGQFLSLRPDLIPQDYCDEFTRLLDKIEPLPFPQVKSAIESGLGKRWNALFRSIEKRPLGSASVAQVHKAQLKSGEHVVIKVMRPGIAEVFKKDIQLMHFLAKKAERRWPHLDPVGMVREFERYTKRELNFVFEARNIDTFAKNFRSWKKVVVPRVFWSATTERVLTMQYLAGEKLTAVLSRRDQPARFERIAKTLAEATVAQFFDFGTFHADLHPGNVIIMSGDRIGLLDFGIVGSLDQRLRRMGIRFYTAIVERDTEHIMHLLLAIGAPTQAEQLDALRNDVSRIVNAWYEEPGRARISNMMNHLFIAATKRGIAMPTDLLLLGKGLLTADATARVLDPEFDFVHYTRPIVERLLKKERAPTRLVQRFSGRAKELSETLIELPEELLEVTRLAKTGKLWLDLKDTDVRHLGMDVNLSSNRVSLALVAAACIVASALLAEIGPTVLDYPLVSSMAIIAAFFFLIPLTVSIWREGRSRHDPHKGRKSIA